MSWPVKGFVLVLLAMVLLSLVPAGGCYGTGVKVFVPTQQYVSADTIPFTYNNSFMVYNDGYRDGVYVIRVSVTEPQGIDWLNLSYSVFTLRPGESKIVNFSINVTEEQAVPGQSEFVFMPTLLTTHVEPYIDQFASYISIADPFNFTLTLPGQPPAAGYGMPAGIPVVFADNRTNLIQSSILQDHRVVTLLDRAIKLNAPSDANIEQPVPLSVSVFEGLSMAGISMMAVSPDGTLYHVSGDNFTFNKPGLWGVVVLVGDEIILGKTVNVSGVSSPLAALDTGTILAGISLLVLVSVVPLWLMTPARIIEKDPYDDIVYKASVIKKYIDKFDKQRLQRAVQMLRDEYSDLTAKGAKGKKDEALAAINELNTLASLE